MALSTKTGLFSLRRAMVGGHVEFEGPGRLVFGDAELPAGLPVCSSLMPPQCRYQV